MFYTLYFSNANIRISRAQNKIYLVLPSVNTPKCVTEMVGTHPGASAVTHWCIDNCTITETGRTRVRPYILGRQLYLLKAAAIPCCRFCCLTYSNAGIYNQGSRRLEILLHVVLPTQMQASTTCRDTYVKSKSNKLSYLLKCRHLQLYAWAGAGAIFLLSYLLKCRHLQQNGGKEVVKTCELSYLLKCRHLQPKNFSLMASVYCGVVLPTQMQARQQWVI